MGSGKEFQSGSHLEFDGEGRVLDLSVERHHAVVVLTNLDERSSVRHARRHFIAHLVSRWVGQADVGDADAWRVINRCGR